MRYYLVVLICISRITSDAENLFLHLLTIHVSSFIKYLFQVFALFSFDFFSYGFVGILYILNTDLFLHMLQI